ncbi:MAG TPA: HAMP domain-containing sensor histidine kinase, partial [Bacillota bacterium]|nr:HAMP domain-containing sensor histidine kinase [Bacillota bacterium]
ISDTFLEDALNLIKSDSGKIVLDDSDWAYQVTYHDDQIVYGFLDITSEQTLLSNMVTTFIIVFLGSFIAVYIISSIITNRSVAKIKEAFLKQKQFVSNASHEIKTPLAIINTNVDVLQSKIKDEDNRKWLNYIKYETDRMNKLTRDLLYLTKVSEQKSLEIVKERLNLSEMTESIILSFEALAYEKNITISYDLAPEIFTEFAKEQYSQVIHILLDNAIKYTPNKGQIDFQLTATHNNITLSVKNTGEGISKEDIGNIFDRFYMVDKSRSVNPNSYGLGLSIAKSIIDNHGGKITCESVEGESTTFTVKLKIKHL